MPIRHDRRGSLAGFACLGEPFPHPSSSTTFLAVQGGADTDGVRVGLRHPAAEGGDFALHCVS